MCVCMRVRMLTAASRSALISALSSLAASYLRLSYDCLIWWTMALSSIFSSHSSQSMSSTLSGTPLSSPFIACSCCSMPRICVLNSGVLYGVTRCCHWKPSAAPLARDTRAVWKARRLTTPAARRRRADSSMAGRAGGAREGCEATDGERGADDESTLWPVVVTMEWSGGCRGGGSGCELGAVRRQHSSSLQSAPTRVQQAIIGTIRAEAAQLTAQWSPLDGVRNSLTVCATTDVAPLLLLQHHSCSTAAATQRRCLTRIRRSAMTNVSLYSRIRCRRSWQTLLKRALTTRSLVP